MIPPPHYAAPSTSLDQQPDTQPGNYYVSAVDSGRTWLMLGPFPDDHAAALAAVPAVRDVVAQHDPSGRGHFYAYGTVRLSSDYASPGNANKYLPHLLPVPA